MYSSRRWSPLVGVGAGACPHVCMSWEYLQARDVEGLREERERERGPSCNCGTARKGGKDI